MASATIERLVDELNRDSDITSRLHRVVVTYTFEATINRRLPQPRVGQARGTVAAQVFYSIAEGWASLGSLTVRGTDVLDYQPETFTPYRDAKTVLEALERARRPDAKGQ